MHELSLTKDILGVAERYARKSGAAKVVSIFLRVGVMRDLEPEWMRRYFRYISKGSIAEGAEILVMVEPVVLRCNNCDHQFTLDLKKVSDQEVLCPECAVHDYELVSGLEFIIQGIEVA